ncbi:EAL domain-containing protein [Acidithiobacillus sp.]
MEASQGLFFEFDREGIILLSRYRKLLTRQSKSLAKSFYAYLLSQAPTAAVFADYSEAQMQALAAAQADHARQLLTMPFDESWRERVLALGRLHQAHGIEIAWIAGSYLIYQRHWDHIVHAAVPDQDREPLRVYLRQLLMRDLMLQLEGYGRGAQDTDKDRSVLFTAMIRSITGVPADANAEDFLCTACRELIRDNPSLRWSWYALIEGNGEPVRPRCVYGIESHPVITESAEDLCWIAMHGQQPVIYRLDDLAAAAWLEPLRDQVAEIAIMPFGVDGQRVVVVVGSSEIGYFRRVGIDHFTAFAYMGDLVMTLQQQSLRDSLTGLPNRMALDDRMDAALARTLRHQCLLAVIMFDLDGFKAVNDSYGHAAGDQLLVQLARRLQGLLRDTDSVIRLGGDELVFLLEDLERWTDLEAAIGRIRAAAETPFLLDTHEVQVSASMGVTIYPLDDGKSRYLLHHADLALYDAKAHKATRSQSYVLYDPSVVQDANSPMRIALRERFHRMLDENVVVLYQPILHVESGEIREVEALARLRDGKRTLPTEEFLPYLSSLDRRILSCKVLEQATSQWRHWEDAGISLSVAVNFEPMDLLNLDTVKKIRTLLDRHQMPPERLIIEVLEGGEFLDAASAKVQLARIKAMGVRVTLDDLGSAYASLLRLKDLPFDAIKLDQAFSLELEQRPKDLHFLLSMLDLANGLGVDLIVEGVASPDVLAAVRMLGIPHIQGYAIAKPLPPKMLSSFLTMGPYGRGHCDHLFAVYAKFLVVSRGLRIILLHMPVTINSEVISHIPSGPLHQLLDSIPNIDELRIQLHRLVAGIVMNTRPLAEGIADFDRLVAAILKELERAILDGFLTSQAYRSQETGKSPTVGSEFHPGRDPTGD